MKAKKGGEIIFSTDNKVGKLEEIARLIKDNGINIRAISAWVIDGKAFFRLVSSDNTKAREALQNLGKDIDEKEVVIVDIPDKVGQLFALASKLKDNNIDLKHIYGTTSQSEKTAAIIFSSNNNDKALKIIAG